MAFYLTIKNRFLDIEMLQLFRSVLALPLHSPGITMSLQLSILSVKTKVEFRLDALTIRPVGNSYTAEISSLLKLRVIWLRIKFSDTFR